MQLIEHETMVRATPAAVFDLISRVEPFTRLTEAVKQIEPLGDGHYRWHVRVAGIKLRFEVQVIDIRAPEQFAWESVTGIPNRGRYTLTPCSEGTRLHLTLEYQLRNRILEKAIAGTTQTVVKRLSEEIVTNVEKELRPDDST